MKNYEKFLLKTWRKQDYFKDGWKTFTVKLFKQTECTLDSSLSRCDSVTGFSETNNGFSLLIEIGRFLASWVTVILRRWVLFHRVSCRCLRQGSDIMS
jgi:hypothetical protein